MPKNPVTWQWLKILPALCERLLGFCFLQVIIYGFLRLVGLENFYCNKWTDVHFAFFSIYQNM